MSVVQNTIKRYVKLVTSLIVYVGILPLSNCFFTNLINKRAALVHLCSRKNLPYQYPINHLNMSFRSQFTLRQTKSPTERPGFFKWWGSGNRIIIC
ncbi:hypothetical protein Pcar_3457 [Syntrophotalea carbinolica DSM 2380]|uniref:Uncharacterized protein n=1 Tax=Syntrophotalea carbinolica (strain DSM 2380 / NBRC 103641 / GraBd1) TaxID=338963 RepID=J9U408_SYNC1|nr:hypothetical protein Pcar_3457 [Syntrophotalea carbinolica DSM 2380]